jgi:hypothetical protein
MHARLIRDDAMVPSRSLLLATAVCVTQSHSASRPEPPVAVCRLRTMVRFSKRMCGRRGHRIGCQKHRIQSGSCSISLIRCPRLQVDSQQVDSQQVDSQQVDSRQSCSARRETMGLRNRSGLGQVAGQAGNSNAIEHLALDENTGLAQQF